MKHYVLVLSFISISTILFLSNPSKEKLQAVFESRHLTSVYKNDSIYKYVKETQNYINELQQEISEGPLEIQFKEIEKTIKELDADQQNVVKESDYYKTIKKRIAENKINNETLIKTLSFENLDSLHKRFFESKFVHFERKDFLIFSTLKYEFITREADLYPTANYKLVPSEEITVCLGIAGLVFPTYSHKETELLSIFETWLMVYRNELIQMVINFLRENK